MLSSDYRWVKANVYFPVLSNKNFIFDLFCFYANLSNIYYEDLQHLDVHIKSIFRHICAFNGTIFHNFADYASVALETKWLH